MFKYTEKLQRNSFNGTDGFEKPSRGYFQIPWHMVYTV